MSTTKLCRKCGQTKSEKGWCRPCKAKYAKAWRNKNPERAKANDLRSRIKNKESCRHRARVWYLNNSERAKAAMALRRRTKPLVIKNEKLMASFGITLTEYESISKRQNHACAICGVPAVELTKKMAVDHNHTTGKVRALLCNNCNAGLGYFKDNKQILTQALKYLYEHDHNHSQNVGK